MIRRTHLLLAGVIATFGAFCFVPDLSNDDNQAAVRENTVDISGSTTDFDVSQYSFIKADSNYIDLNGDDWSSLAQSLKESSYRPFSVVHIGDSHIQADVSTGRIRKNFQNKFGSGGRGLITPLKIAGTNEPYNYRFETTAANTSAKLLKMPWMTDMGFTGVAFTPTPLKFDLKLSTLVQSNPEGEEFNRVRIFTNGKIFIDRVLNESNQDVKFTASAIDDEDYVDIKLESMEPSITINAHSFEPVTIFGAELIGNDNGVRYHAIGNNGATYSSYNRLGSMGCDISRLNPDLVVISLGTNESFSNMEPDMLEAEIDYLVKDIKRNNPSAKILLTTPMECQKAQRVSRTKRSRSGQRRTVYSVTKNYVINDKVKIMRDAIIKYGNNHSIPVYDWYNIAGGDGASNKWLDAGLMSKDRIHDTFLGYEVTGDLTYNAIINAITSSI
ncbi:MAG: hypothetical protein K2H44_09615 [Muribaculaceae bacterium]|nr:hypothetical protein [Muribaculaceae bacterium]